jgi:protein-disulfide isomerase
MKSRPLLLLVLLLLLLLAGGVFAVVRQSRGNVQSLTTQINALNEGQTALRTELREIHDLLRRQPTAAVVTPAPTREIVLSLGDAPFKGNANANLTLVEFTDYECGFCARHVRETMPQLERDYISTGKLKYVFRNFPLESIHKKSFKAHEAASCAGEQGRFWEMHDQLFANQTALAPADLIGHAQAVGLDSQRFQSCFAVDLHAPAIRKDMADGQKAGVTSTPAFFLGVTQPGSQTLKVATTIKGAKPYAAFKEAIDALLGSQPPSS